jgi:glycosyltransferase involved in cell wall biosynthesis
MKNIIVFTAYYHPHVGGVENNIEELSSRLREYGYKVDLLTFNTEHSPIEEQLRKIHVYRLSCWNILDGGYPIAKPSLANWKVFSRLLKNNYDIVSTQTRFFQSSMLGLIFAKLKKIPVVHTEHGSRHTAMSNKLFESFSTTYDHTLGTILVKSATFNLGVSEAAAEFLKHLKARNVKVVPNGIDTTRYQKKDSNWRKQLGISEKDIVVTFTGRLIPSKGVQDLITIFPRVQKVRPGIKLLIVGDGPYRKELEKRVKIIGAGDSILFLGMRNQSEVVQILSASDIFINPSYSEGLPTSVMEAASVGLPILATDVGGTREIIIDGELGFLVKEKDLESMQKKLVELISNEPLRQKFGKKARQFVSQKYDWQKIAEHMINILECVDATGKTTS